MTSWDERELRGHGRCATCEHHLTEVVTHCIRRMRCTLWDHPTEAITPVCTEYHRSAAERASRFGLVVGGRHGR